MFSRYIDNFDFKSRFRILKGGKVSLVVSAMLFGSTVNAAYTTINSSNSYLLPYSSTLSTNDIVEMASDVNITLASSSIIIDVNLNGWLVDISNTGILNNNNNSAASSGIKVYDLSLSENATGKSRIANSGTIAVNNTSFSAYGITSSNSGNKNWNDFNLLNSGTISTRGVGFSKAIFIDGTLEDSTITNNSTGSILATGLDNSTEVYGIHVPGDGTSNGYSMKESQITNNGVITSSGLKSSYGIYMIGKISDSKILNSTTGKITATTTKTLNSNTNINDEISAYTSAMELGNVITNTNGTETSVKNAGTIESNTTENIQLGGSITTKGIYASSSAVDINKLTGSDTTGTVKFENSGNISATSKLKFTGGASLNANNFGYSSHSSGLFASNVYKALIDNTSTGNITALSEMDIPSSYRISNLNNSYADSSGMKFATLEDSTVNNNGMIDSKAIYNSKEQSYVTSRSLYVAGDIISSDIISKNMKSTAQSSSIFNNAKTVSVGIESVNIKDSSTLKNIGIIDVNGTSNASPNASTEVYGIRSFGMDTSNIINGVENGDNSTVQIKVAAESISANEARIIAKGIEIVNFIDSTIKNYGKIDVTGTTSSSLDTMLATVGISLASDVSSSSEPIYSVLNEGTIIVKSNPTVTNSQNQRIAVTAKGISATHNVSSADFTLENKGTIEAYINDKLDKNAYSLDVKGSDDYIKITNTGILKGNINVEGKVTNSGTIELPYNTDNASITNYVNEASGILKVGLLTDGTSQGTTYSKLATTSAVFKDGSTIDVNVLDNSTNVGLLLGNILNNVVTSNALTVEGALNVKDNSALVNFQKVVTANSIDLKVVQAQTISDAVTDPTPTTPTTPDPTPTTPTTPTTPDPTPTTPEIIKISTKSSPTQYVNAKKAAKVLDEINTEINNHPEMESVISKLNQLPTNESVAKAVESTTSQLMTSSQTAASQISTNIANVVMQRQNPSFGTGINSGDEQIVNDKSLWIKPYGSLGAQANKDGLNGFDVESYGIGMGFDSKNKNDQMAGVGLFFTDANVDMNNISQESDLKAYTMMMYGSLPVIDNKTNFLYQLGYTLQKTDSTRDVFTGDVASADFTSKLGTIDLKLVRDYQINNNLLLQPLVSTTYRNFKSPSYSETGAGALNLEVDKTSTNEMIVGLGTIATYKLNPTDKLIGSLNVGYDLRDDKNSLVSSYQGANTIGFETQGIDNGRWSYDMGVGYEKSIDNKNSINVNYNLQAEGTDYINNVVSANYVLKF